MKIDFKKTSTILFLIGLLLFSYTVIRAFLLSITWDEAFSYLQYTRNGIYIEDKFNEMSANNHWLNTWLCIHFTKWFGVSEFVLRIPSLLAHIIFLYSSAKIVLRFSNKWVIIFSFLILNCNPYVVDFFSLSRGYALSISFMLFSVLYVIKYVSEEYKIKFALLSIVSALFAVLSNLVLLNYFVVLFALFAFLLLVNFILTKENRKKYAIQFFILENCMIIALLLIIPTILKLRVAGAFFYGANNSFWTDTVRSSIISCFYGFDYTEWGVYFFKLVLIITVCTALIYLFFRFRKKQFNADARIIFSLLFLICVTALAFIIQHHFLHSLYLIDRTTLFYVVLYSVLLVYTIDVVFKNKKTAIILNGLFLLLALFQFTRSINFSYVWEWKTNYCIKQMVKDLENEKTKVPEKTLISVGAPLAFEMGLNYYRVTKKLYWLNTPDRSEQTNVLHDYCLMEKDAAKINGKKFNVLYSYDETESVFAIPKIRPQQKQIVLKNSLNFSKATNDKIFMLTPDREYSPNLRCEIEDSMLYKEGLIVFVKYKMKVPYEDLNNTSIAISIENNGWAYVWKAVILKEYIKNSRDWNEVEMCCIVPKQIKRGDVIKSYIWNRSTKNIYIKKAEIKVIEYSSSNKK